MADSTKDKTIAYRASEEFRRRLQIAAIERGMKVQGLIDAALEAYLTSDAGSDAERSARQPSGSLGAATPSEQKFLRQMLEFYRLADEASVKLIRQHAAAIAELRRQKTSARKTG